VVENVTFRSNTVRNSGGGINILGYDDLAPTRQTANVRITHNLFYNIRRSYGGSGWFLLLGDQPRTVVVDHNTIDADGSAIVYVYGGPASAPRQILGFQFTNNAVRHNAYGLNGTDVSFGSGILTHFFPNSIVRGNWLQAGSQSRYPAGNYFTGTFESGFVDVAGANYAPAAGGILVGSASDGGNIGADMSALLLARQNVVSGGQKKPRAPANLHIKLP
jgi:hypothetical protein